MGGGEGNEEGATSILHRNQSICKKKKHMIYDIFLSAVSQTNIPVHIVFRFSRRDCVFFFFIQKK